MYKHYKYRGGENINADLDSLPTGELVEIYNGEKIPNFKAVKVSMEGKKHYVSVVTDSYEMVQHKSAFRPFVEAITTAGQKNFNYVIWATPKKAHLQLYVKGEGYDSVNLGFSITNSLDGHSRLKYGFDLNRATQYIEMVGYRQVCSNGMKVRVPLKDAEIIRPELKVKIETLLKDSLAITHTESIKEKLEVTQYITEALTLLREPVEIMIKKAQKFSIDNEKKLKELIKLHVGKRFKSKVLDAYANENSDAWGLYNAITWVASHDEDLTDTARETLLEKGAVLLADVTRGR